jgi:hypothetical protein
VLLSKSSRAAWYSFKVSSQNKYGLSSHANGSILIAQIDARAANTSNALPLLYNQRSRPHQSCLKRQFSHSPTSRSRERVLKLSKRIEKAGAQIDIRVALIWSVYVQRITLCFVAQLPEQRPIRRDRDQDRWIPNTNHQKRDADARNLRSWVTQELLEVQVKRSCCMARTQDDPSRGGWLTLGSELYFRILRSCRLAINIGVRALFSNTEILPLGDHADRREVQTEMTGDLLKLEVMQSNGFMNPTISISSVVDVGEELFECRPRCIAFSAEHVLIKRLLKKCGPDRLNERFSPQQVSDTQRLPNLHTTSLANELAVCPNSALSLCAEAQGSGLYFWPSLG